MEDHRAEPRNRPPQLETNGLYDKPTLLSNVETFAWAPAIWVKGGQWYRDQGVRGCLGLRFFSISGDLNKPGAYEVPNGITLRELIADHCGGMRDGRPLAAFAPSGPSGGFLPAQLPIGALPRAAREKLPAGATHLDILDLELDLQHFRDLGLMLGAGMVVYAAGADLVDQAASCLDFFRNESCGKCVPCRLGSHKLAEIGQRLRGRELDSIELEGLTPLVRDLARTMELTSICGLGMVAAAPLTSLLANFPQDVKHSLRNGKST
jgi:NADH:ubiquinone oxidoreductase subunit F (NADH-binding)